MNYKLTLGPNLFNWKVNDWRDFYFQMADTPVDEVYIGEVVCYKRFPFFEVALDDVIERLTSSGKKINISTFSLILGELEMKTCKKLIEKYSDTLDFEINDVGLLGLLKDKKHIIGPTINVYNEGTAKALEKQNAYRICFPYELDGKSISHISKDTTSEKEVFAFGRMPLAIAARCYHARIHGTTKDDCRYVCEKDYNGKDVTALDGQKFLSVNGTQTMSQTYCNLVQEVPKLKEAGVSIFRLSPHFMDMTSIVNIFRSLIDEKISPDEAEAKLKDVLPEDVVSSNGFFYGKEGRNKLKSVVE